MLPVPKNPMFMTPEVSEEEFNNPKLGEDEALINTGAFDDDMSRGELIQSALDNVRALKESFKNK